jgi:hypothetical protein
MDEDNRFPNRKRKREQPGLPDTLPDAEWQELNNESGEAEPLPVSGYRVVRSASESPGEEPVEAELPAPVSASGEAPAQDLIDLSASAEEQASGAAPPVPHPTSRDVWLGRIRKFAESPARVNFVLVGVFVLLLGGLIAVSLLFLGTPNGRYDLGPVTSSATGLAGRLFIQWDRKLEYRLTIKLSDPDLQAGFALAVANSPRPLSIAIHLQDPAGFVLCSREIALKSDARNGAAPAAPAADSLKGTTDSGQDTFQNQIGPDGQIAAINSQGELSCSAEAYEKATKWSISTNFPSLAEQDEWLSRQKEIEAGAGLSSPAGVAARKRIAAKSAARLLPFSIEGDDAIVDFDTSHGVIQTRGRKTFLVDKATAAAADPRWQDYPVSIHYRCDQSSSCTLRDAGVGVLRASLGR